MFFVDGLYKLTKKVAAGREIKLTDNFESKDRQQEGMIKKEKKINKSFNRI